MMPLLSAYISYIMPLALGIYWLLGNVLQMLTQWIVNMLLKKQKIMLGVRILLTPSHQMHRKRTKTVRFFIFLLVQKYSNMVVAPPAHHVCHDLLVTSGARSSVQAHSLAITFTTSLIVRRCTNREKTVISIIRLVVSLSIKKNEPLRFVFVFGFV